MDEEVQHGTKAAPFLGEHAAVLARRLKNRPDRDALIDRHIIPAHSAAPGLHDKVTQLERKKTGDFLQKKIRARPSRQQLIQRHILTETRADPSLLENMGRLERQRITDSLNERLQARPGPIELIQEGILPVDSPIQNALDEGDHVLGSSLSPQSSVVDSPNVADLENGITTLNCTSPSPPLHDSAFSESYNNHFHNITNDNINPNCLVRKLSVDSSTSYYGAQTPISLSQKENEKLVRTLQKKSKPPKTKVKKLKFHECRPPEMVNQDSNSNIEVDERYKKLLEQQTLYLRLQVLQQNAMMNALQGNSESMEAVTEEIENVIKKEKTPSSDPQPIKSIEGKKLDDLRVIDLRAQLKQRGLLVSGTKAKLIERLSAFEQGRATASDFSYSSNNSLNENLSHISSMPPITNGELSPATSTVVQVTTYSTSAGQTYQVIQAVSQQSRNVYQVLPPQCVPTSQQLPQIQLNHVNIHPVVEVTQPHVMTIEDAVSDTNQAGTPIQHPTSASQLHFQMSPRSNTTAPTILIHSGPQLQKASLLQHEKPRVQLQQYPNFRHNPYQMSESVKLESTSLSQSLSASQYNRNKYIISPSKNDISQHLSALKTHESEDEKKILDNTNEPTSFRSRSSSEPQHLARRHEYTTEHSMKQHAPAENFKTLTNQSSLPLPGYKQSHRKSTETIRRDTYDDIMDIIGELSTPSPSNAGSPLMTTSPTSSFHMGSTIKVEHPPPYNSCAYNNNQKSRNTSDNKCLSVSPQHKLFSSVPENINTLGSSHGNNFLSSPYGSLSPNSLNGSLSSNLSGSLSNLQANQSASYSNLNHSGSTGNIQSHSSSTGNIPQQIQSDNYQKLSGSPNMSSYGTSPNTSSNYLKIDYRAVSPMDLHPDDNLAMDLDNFSSTNTQNNTLGWLDLNMESNSPSDLSYQSIPPKEIHRNSTYYSHHNSNSNMTEMNPSMVHANALYGNNTRTQNSMSYNSRLPEGCISLFDLDGADY